MKQDPRLVTPEISKEFSGAKRLTGQSRLLALEQGAMGADYPRIFFGLKDADGGTSYFAGTLEEVGLVALDLRMMILTADPEPELPALFKGTSLKLGRAAQLLGELEFLMHSYTRALRFEVFPLADDDQHSIIRAARPLPIELPVMVGDIVHNLRSSLDIFLCELAALRERRREGLKFPFADTEAKYADQIRNGHVRRLGSDVQAALLEVKAFRGGNDELRGLHELNNIDKHRLIIPVMAMIWVRYDISSLLEERIVQAGKKPMKVAYFGDYGDAMQLLLKDGDVVPNSELKHYQFDTGRPATALFDKDMPFAGNHVLPKLYDLYNATLATVQELAGKLGYPTQI